VTSAESALLIVEDDENVRSLLVTLARKYCTRIDTAADGMEALMCLRQHAYDLVLLDIMLPNVNGLEVAAAIQKLPAQPKLVVLSAISRYFKDHFGEDVIVLQKPFDIRRVEEILRTYGGGPRRPVPST
jgi:CheY-like chemotaxis protein